LPRPSSALGTSAFTMRFHRLTCFRFDISPYSLVNVRATPKLKGLVTSPSLYLVIYRMLSYVASLFINSKHTYNPDFFRCKIYPSRYKARCQYFFQSIFTFLFYQVLKYSVSSGYILHYILSRQGLQGRKYPPSRPVEPQKRLRVIYSVIIQ
jgi:hypothetical protein